MPCEDLDNPDFSGPNAQSKRSLTPLPDKFNHLREGFDRGSIYAACRSAFMNTKNSVKNIHCFYFGSTHYARDFELWKGTNDKIQNRIFLLEEMLYVAKVVYSIDSITLTSVSMVKHRLISKRLMKDLYKSPKDPDLKVNSMTLTGKIWYTCLGDRARPSQNRYWKIFYDDSLQNDLDNIYQTIKNFNGSTLDIDQKYIFSFPMLTRKEILKIQDDDQEYAQSFYSYPLRDYDVSNEELLKSNSLSKYAKCDGLRTTLTIPSNDYPVMVADGSFTLPLCEEILFHPLLRFLSIHIDQDSMRCYPLDFSKDDINFSWESITDNQIERFIFLHLAFYNYQQHFPIPFDYKFLNLLKYKTSIAPTPFTVLKENGKRVVYVDENYIHSSAVYDLNKSYSVIDYRDWISDENFMLLSFTSQTESGSNFECSYNPQNVLLLDLQSSLIQENRFVLTIDFLNITFDLNKDM